MTKPTKPAPAEADAVRAALAPDRFAYAVLSADLGELREGQIVVGLPDRIAALVADGGGVIATAAQIEAAAPLHYPLPKEA